MQFQRLSRDESIHATGVTIVIDVLRAFTSACYAFGAGAQEIFLVSEVAQAFALCEQFPAAKLMGEVGGGPIAGFDFSNSPDHYAALDLTGQRLIQRTSNGTQGVIRATQAETTLVASFVCAAATAHYVRQLAPRLVTFVITAWHADATDPRQGDEDAACADYLEALLSDTTPDPASYLRRVAESPTGQLFQSNTRPEYPATDLPYCIALDKFNFALPVERRPDGHIVMQPHHVKTTAT